MPRNRQLLLSTVFQTVLLLTCTTITTHHLWTSASGKFTSIELYKNYTDATKLRIQPETPADIVLPPISTITFDISDPLNFTIHNTNTTNTDETYPPEGAVEYEDEDEEASFYKHQLPRTVITHIIISLLACYWQLALERAFPARPRPPPSSSPHSEVNAKTGEYEDSREEEVIKKWMAQGKVRRASLSWCNTLVKWLLDVVVGGLWVTAVSCMVGRVLDFEPEEGVLEGLKGQVFLNWVLSLIGTRNLASLIAMIVIPAHKRIVFVAALELGICTFVGLFANLLIPWVASTEFGQGLITNLTEEMRNPMVMRRTDEL